MTQKAAGQTKQDAKTTAMDSSGFLQRAAVGAALATDVHEVLRSSGRPLDSATRAFMQPRFGYDFSRVHMHSARPGALQAHLAVSTPGDMYEQEADRMASAVVGGNTLNPFTAPSAPLQRRESNGRATPKTAPPIVPEMLRSSGQPLDASTCDFMESRFGQDFSGVRVHTDDKAAASARAVNAQAYTMGRDVVFGAGRYVPGTKAGKELLAHELTHVAQQTVSGVGGGGDLTVGPSASAEEREADTAAWRVSGGDSLGAPVRPMPCRIQRKVLSAEEIKAMNAARKPSDPMAKMGLLPSVEDFKTYTARDLIPPTEVKSPPKDPPTDKTPTDKAPVPPAKPEQAAKDPAGAKEADDKSGVALQLGVGQQRTPTSKDPRVQNDPTVNYVQVTVMLHDVYLIEGKDIAPWLKNFSFLGEPGVQLQYHLSGAATDTVDAQVLFNAVQLSLDAWKHKLDISLVAGGMVNDLKAFKLKNTGKRLTPIPAGVDVELGLVKISPSLKLTLDVQGLVGLPYLDAAGGRAGGRKAVVQGSGELRLVVEF